MDHNFALGQDDLERGYVLTCQSHPTSPEVSVDYDGVRGLGTSEWPVPGVS